MKVPLEINSNVTHSISNHARVIYSVLMTSSYKFGVKRKNESLYETTIRDSQSDILLSQSNPSRFLFSFFFFFNRDFTDDTVWNTRTTHNCIVQPCDHWSMRLKICSNWKLEKQSFSKSITHVCCVFLSIYENRTTQVIHISPSTNFEFTDFS